MTHTRISPETVPALKGCPFCGGDDVSVYNNRIGDMHFVTCKSCGLEAPTETGTGEDAAIRYWNTRAGHAQTARKPVSFMEAMDIVEAGLEEWRQKPHNAIWWRHIDGTPIPNDLTVNIAEAICHSRLSSSPVTSTDRGEPVGIEEIIDAIRGEIPLADVGTRRAARVLIDRYTITRPTSNGIEDKGESQR